LVTKWIFRPFETVVRRVMNSNWQRKRCLHHAVRKERRKKKKEKKRKTHESLFDNEDSVSLFVVHRVDNGNGVTIGSARDSRDL